MVSENDLDLFEEAMLTNNGRVLLYVRGRSKT